MRTVSIANSLLVPTLLTIAAGGANAQSVSLQSVSSSGLTGTIDSSSSPIARLPSISADGRYIVFTSGAANFTPGDGQFSEDVFVHDRQDGSTACASLTLSGVPSNGSSSLDADVSADGRFVAFWSDAPSLVVGDTNGEFDIFVRDMLSGTTERASVSSTGAQANADSSGPKISGDGRYVVFSSSATNLVPGDVPFTGDVFVRDLVAQTTELVTVDTNGGVGNGSGGNAELSVDGRYVCFQTSATDLVAQDLNGLADIFLRDRTAGTTELVSVSTAGVRRTT